MTGRAQTVTILFTDLVGSTELLQDVGDERAERIFRAHRRTLSETVVVHNGHEVKWLGDGLMVAFTSVTDAVACAVAMQQATQRPAGGRQLAIRAGINVGEVTVDAADYFGSPVVVARRLCDRAVGGQILASDIVVRMLDGRVDGARATDLGALHLKGITSPVPTFDIGYARDPLALLRTLPFTGRDDEVSLLQAKLRAAAAGSGAIILLAGEPGVGKTRLVEEFCEHASHEALIARGNCHEGDGAAPFGPWTQALRAVAESLDDPALTACLDGAAADLAFLVPEIRDRVGVAAPDRKLDPEAERSRHFAGIAAFLGRAARAKPLVLFLDDLHWADRPSLALLGYVAPQIERNRVLIICTYRDMDVDRTHPLSQTLATLRRMAHHERVAVRGLDSDRVYDLLTVIEPAASAEPSRRALAAVLAAEAAGNPFFIREVLNNLVETGRMVQQDGVWTGVVSSVSEIGIPEGVKEITGRRLSRLSDACNRMLQRASLMPGGFTWEELAAISEEREDALLDTLDEALAAQLIVEEAAGRYTFMHSLIRATLYDELSTPRRVAMHRRVAESLERLYAADVDTHAAELASHYLASAGGDATKAVDYSLRAADRAMRLLAWEEAAAHYERAVQAMDLVPAYPDEARCRALLALAQCNRVALNDEASIPALRSLITTARRIGSPELLARGAMAFEEAAERLEQDLTAERLSALDEALAALGDVDGPLKAQALCYWVRATAAARNARLGRVAAGFFGWAGGQEAATIARARDAVAMAERAGDDTVTARAVRILHDCAWTPDNDSERIALIDRGIAAATRAGSVFLLGELHNAKAMDLLALGDIPAFQSNAGQYGALVAELGARGGYVLPMRVGLEIAAGHLREAESHLNEYANAHAGDITLTFTALGQRYGISHLRGTLDDVEALWQAVVERMSGIALFPAVLAWIDACAGRHDRARDRVTALLADGMAAVPRDFLWKATVCLLADTAAEVGDAASARSLAPALAPYTGTYAAVAQTLSLGSMARVAGRLATTLEDWERAERLFTAALDANERAGFRAWSAWTRMDHAAMLLRRDGPADRSLAESMLREALAFAQEVGMGKVERDCARLLGVQA